MTRRSKPSTTYQCQHQYRLPVPMHSTTSSILTERTDNNANLAAVVVTIDPYRYLLVYSCHLQDESMHHDHGGIYVRH